MVNSRFFWPTTKRLPDVSVSLVGGYLCRYLSTKLAKHIDNFRKEAVCHQSRHGCSAHGCSFDCVIGNLVLRMRC